MALTAPEATIASAGLDLASSAYNNRLAEKRQHQAQDFNEGMFGKRYQMQVADLKAAGLNPMLAYGASPGQGPTTSAAPVSNYELGSSFDRARQTSAQSVLQAKQTELAEAEITVKKNTAENIAADTLNKTKESDLILAKTKSETVSAAEASKRIEEIDQRIKQIQKNLELMEVQIKTGKAEAYIKEDYIHTQRLERQLTMEKIYLTQSENQIKYMEGMILQPSAYASQLGSAYSARKLENIGDMFSNAWKIFVPRLGGR